MSLITNFQGWIAPADNAAGRLSDGGIRKALAPFAKILAGSKNLEDALSKMLEAREEAMQVVRNLNAPKYRPAAPQGKEQVTYAERGTFGFTSGYRPSARVTQPTASMKKVVDAEERVRAFAPAIAMLRKLIAACPKRKHLAAKERAKEAKRAERIAAGLPAPKPGEVKGA